MVNCLIGMFGRRQAEKELAKEIAAHLDFAEADNKALGMSRAGCPTGGRPKIRWRGPNSRSVPRPTWVPRYD
ncbi:MAG TPA: hypothetical protein VH702_19070 [Vicinamibacterales bacterium]